MSEHRSIGWVTVGPADRVHFCRQVERCECGHPIRERYRRRFFHIEERDEFPRWESEGGAL